MEGNICEGTIEELSDFGSTEFFIKVENIKANDLLDKSIFITLNNEVQSRGIIGCTEVDTNIYKVFLLSSFTKELSSGLGVLICDVKRKIVDFEELEVDNVNSPAHYNQGKYELMDIADDQNLNRYAFNILKYVVRAPFKNGIEDLLKAQWYLNRYIEKVKDGTVKL
jgi:hypothetical protein